MSITHFRSASIPILLFMLFACLMTPARGQSPDIQPSVDLPPELDRVLRDYERAWQARDENGLAALFTPDGFVMSPGRPAVRGRENIVRRYADSGGPLALRALAYSVADSAGYIIGGYARETGAPDVGKFILALRRNVEGRWLIMADMDNGNS